MEEDEQSGYRVWEIQKGGIPKQIESGSMESLEDGSELLDNLDLDIKTYAIRIGKKGLI